LLREIYKHLNTSLRIWLHWPMSELGLDWWYIICWRYTTWSGNRLFIILDFFTRKVSECC
jgi:hypothetical protein